MENSKEVLDSACLVLCAATQQYVDHSELNGDSLFRYIGPLRPKVPVFFNHEAEHTHFILQCLLCSVRGIVPGQSNPWSPILRSTAESDAMQLIGIFEKPDERLVNELEGRTAKLIPYVKEIFLPNIGGSSREWRGNTRTCYMEEFLQAHGLSALNRAASDLNIVGPRFQPELAWAGFSNTVSSCVRGIEGEEWRALSELYTVVMRASGHIYRKMYGK